MNNKTVYTILAVSLALNLFGIGVFAGKAMHHPRFRPEFGEMFKGRHHEFAMRDHGMMGKDGMRPDMRRPDFDGRRPDMMGKRDFDKKRGFRGGLRHVFCKNVGEEVAELEKAMLDKNEPLFKKSFEEGMKLKEALRAEFIKETLDTAKIKELFTKQTEGFITIQKQAQDSLLEIIEKLPAQKRAEAICFGKSEDKGALDKPEDAKEENNVPPPPPEEEGKPE